MRQTSFLFKLLLSCLWTLTAVSCLSEKDYDCRTRLTLSFSYTLNAEQKDLLAQEVQQISLYLFRADGTLSLRKTIEVSSLSSTHSLTLEVDPGSYRVVAWGNLQDDYYQVSQSSLTYNDMQVNLLTNPAGEVDADAPALFYGQAVVDTHTLRETRAALSFTRNTNQIHVLLEPSGATRTLPDTDVSVRISASNGTLDFDNNKAATEPTIYRPHYGKTIYQEKAYDQAIFRVLNLEVGDDTRIGIFREDDMHYQQSLTGLIMQYFPYINSNEDFARYSDYTLVYRYDTDTGVYVLTSLAVEGWTEQVSQPGGIR